MLSQPFYQPVSKTAWLHHVITWYPRGVYGTSYCTLHDWFWGIVPPPIAECVYEMEICVRGQDPGESDIIRTRSDWPWGPPSLLFNVTGFFPLCKAWRWPLTPSEIEVKERVDLYIYSTSGTLWLLIGWKLNCIHICTCVRYLGIQQLKQKFVNRTSHLCLHCFILFTVMPVLIFSLKCLSSL